MLLYILFLNYKYINFSMTLNNKYINSIFHFIFCTFLVITCSEPTQDILDKRSITEVMLELTVIENMAISDSLKAAKVQKVLNDKKIKIEVLKKTFAAKSDDGLFWESLYDSIEVKLRPINSDE